MNVRDYPHLKIEHAAMVQACIKGLLKESKSPAEYCEMVSLFNDLAKIGLDEIQKFVDEHGHLPESF